MKVLPRPDGHTDDLPESFQTQWSEHNLVCPKSESHVVTGSGRKVYCYDCKVYWERNKL